MAFVIPQQIKQTIGFIFTREEPSNPNLVPAGTGFFTGVQGKAENTSFVYFVTAKHVLSGLSEIYVRLNTRNWDSASGEQGYHYTQLPPFVMSETSRWVIHNDPTVQQWTLLFFRGHLTSLCTSSYL